ncbi:UNVERIFIED_ORG: hypothetical protein B5F06_05985 [Lacrimispora saccharolytica]
MRQLKSDAGSKKAPAPAFYGRNRSFFYITGNFVPCYIKTLRGDRTGLERNTAALQPRRRRRILRGRILCTIRTNFPACVLSVYAR